MRGSGTGRVLESRGQRAQRTKGTGWEREGDAGDGRDPDPDPEDDRKPLKWLAFVLEQEHLRSSYKTVAQVQLMGGAEELGVNTLGDHLSLGQKGREPGLEQWWKCEVSGSKAHLGERAQSDLVLD